MRQSITADHSGPASVRAALNYLFRTGRKPYAYTFAPPPGVPERYGEVNTVADVVIHNGRTENFSLDEQGFQILPHTAAAIDFYDRRQVTDIYYPQIEDLLKSVTGAEKVSIFDHTVRSMPKVREGVKGMREPQRRVHNDFTATSGPRRVRDHLDPAEAGERLKHRFLEINVWRPITGPLEEAPLALCDARTIAEDDFIASDLIYPGKVGEIYAFSYNPGHRWYYFPKMRTDEVLLIKCFDSDEGAKARFTAHTAFDDPSIADPLPRESIEVRALVFLPPA